MDELDLLRRLDATDAPDADRIESDRDRLRAAFAAPGAIRPGDRRPRRWPVLAAAAALVLVAGAVVAVGGRDDSRSTNLADTPPGSTPTTTADAPPVDGSSPFDCGAEVGLRILVPDGFVAPVGGPSPDGASNPLEPGQRAQHWDSSSGSIEVRWPSSHPDGAPEGLIIDTTYVNDRAGVDLIYDTKPVRTSEGRYALTASVRLTDPDPACASFDVTVYHDDRAATRITWQHIEANLFEPPPLIVEARDAETLPPASPCQAPTGVAAQPNRSETVDDGPVFVTPQTALADLLAGRDTWARGGYVELHLPDGSIAYASEPEPDFLPIVVHVAETDAGWTVRSWEIAGC